MAPHVYSARPKFNPLMTKFLANKAFKFKGKNYKIGDKFDAKKLDCSGRELRIFYEQRLLEREPEAVKAPEKKPDDPPKVPMTREEQEKIGYMETAALIKKNPALKNVPKAS